MKKHKKNARPDAATSERAKEPGQASRQGHASNDHDTTPAPPGQAVHIADFLLPGQQNAVPLRNLASLTGLPERDLRRQIERERRAGVLIVSDNRHGYWLAADPGEAQRFARSMKHRAHEILRTARAIEGAGS